MIAVIGLGLVLVGLVLGGLLGLHPDNLDHAEAGYLAMLDPERARRQILRKFAWPDWAQAACGLLVVVGALMFMGSLFWWAFHYLPRVLP